MAVDGTLRFIGGGAGSLTNYEAKPVYHVTVSVADTSGGSSINYTLNITDVNDNRAHHHLGHHRQRAGEYRQQRGGLSHRGDRHRHRRGPALTYSLVAGVRRRQCALQPINNGEIRFTACRISSCLPMPMATTSTTSWSAPPTASAP